MASFVADGWTRTDGYVAAALTEDSGERLYDALEFTYRPATRLDIVKLDAEIAIASKNKDIDPEAAVRGEKIACEFLAKRIVSWNLKNVGIHDVPVSASALEHMHPFLFGHLYRIVRGTQVSDKKPEATAEPKSDLEQLKN